MAARKTEEIIVTALKLIYLFERKRRVTTEDIVAELGVTKQYASRLLDKASRVMPIYVSVPARRAPGRNTHAIWTMLDNRR